MQCAVPQSQFIQAIYPVNCWPYCLQWRTAISRGKEGETLETASRNQFSCTSTLAAHQDWHRFRNKWPLSSLVSGWQIVQRNRKRWGMDKNKHRVCAACFVTVPRSILTQLDRTRIILVKSLSMTNWLTKFASLHSRSYCAIAGKLLPSSLPSLTHFLGIIILCGKLMAQW